MKALKIISGIICAVGAVLIFGVITQNDFNDMVLRETVPTNWNQMIIGMVMVLQCVVITMIRKKHERKSI